jgi:hypothetical protein
MMKTKTNFEKDFGLSHAMIVNRGFALGNETIKLKYRARLAA